MSRPCSAQTLIDLAEPETVIAAIGEHMAEHGGRHETDGDCHIIRFGAAHARFAPGAGGVRIELVAPDLEALYFLRITVASHIVEFAGATDIAWSGDGGAIARPPNFQILEVAGCKDMTPQMRRLTLAGPEVARFAPMNALHVKLLLQQPGLAEPQWPQVGANGLIAWPDPQWRPATRKYTVRAVDQAASTIDIDFVIHADAGPGSALAETAREGDRIGIVGPGGGGLVAADWHLFAGDETALPAIARMLGALPATARGKALIEIASPAEIQPLSSAADIAIEWLSRDGAPAGTTSVLSDAVARVRFPDDGARIHAWAGCEFDAFRAIRSHFRQERGLTKAEHLVVAYWRRGIAESEMAEGE